MTRFTVDRLLEPCSFSRFRDAYYEKQPLFIRRQSPAHYDGLVTLDALDDDLGKASLLTTELRLVRNGETLDEEETAGTEAVFARFHEGCSIAISAYERHRSAVLHLVHDLERVFHAPVAACVHLTPGNAEGVSTAHDRDTFLLQFAGTKTWTVYDGSRKLVTTATLEPGDLLYVPGGLVHESRSADAVSGHLTLALEKYTYADLLRQIADNAQASPWLRRSLPPGIRSGAFNAEFLREVHQFFDDADLPAYLDRMHGDFAEERLPDSANRLADCVKLPSIGAASRFRRRSGLWPELTNGGDQVVLTFRQQSLAFPIAAAETLRFMIATAEFAASALPGNGDENLALCRTLVREGFLTIAG
jgi:bifunctional lysine-specific demethylase and histidyl-hydroxylase NO66